MVDQSSPLQARAPERVGRGGQVTKIKVRTGLSTTALLAKICDEIGTEVDLMLSMNQKRVVVWPRYRLMWTLREIYGWSYHEIGELLSKRDHSTIAHGVARWQNKLNRDARAAEVAEALAR